MIIDCHGHYTTTPKEHQAFRDAQLVRLADPNLPEPPPAEISDEQIHDSIERNQLRLLRERGGDLMLFSPKASGMEHHVADLATARSWARVGNDLLHRVIGADNLLFASEMLGAVRGTNPQTGRGWDDTKPYVERLDLPEADRRKVFELNARHVYPRLDARLAAEGR